jgi:hypothetical protein
VAAQLVRLRLFRRLSIEVLGVTYTRRRGRVKGWRAVAAGFAEYAGIGARRTDALADLLVGLALAVSPRGAIGRVVRPWPARGWRKAVRP